MSKSQTTSLARTDRERFLLCRRTLEQVREAILNAPPEVLTDTLWFSDTETVVDLIDATMERAND